MHQVATGVNLNLLLMLWVATGTRSGAAGSRVGRLKANIYFENCCRKSRWRQVDIGAYREVLQYEPTSLNNQCT
jgi:hypothetical protein